MAIDERNFCDVGLYLFLSFVIIANGNIIESPSNAAVVAGSGMSMRCRTTNGSHVYRWSFIRSNASEDDDVFRNHDGLRGLTKKYSSVFGVDMDDSCSGSLYSNETRLEEAGVYVCRAEVDGNQEPVSAHLTVLETEPICETNYTAEDNVTLTEGEIIWMQCTVNFRGLWAPTFEWKEHTEKKTINRKSEEEDQQVVFNGVSTVTVTNNKVTSTLSYVIGSSKTAYVWCRMHFQWHNGRVQVTAENLPNYTYIWKSQRLLPQRMHLETPEEVEVIPLPVEVGPDRTSTFQPSGSNDWYVISLILLFAVLVFVSLLAGLGMQRYLRSRRRTDLNMVYNASTSSTVPLRRLEGQFAIEYDIVPGAAPNIYERIDGAEAEDDVAASASCRNHPPLTQCYSGLMAAECSDTCQYDTLDLYMKMDVCNPVTGDPTVRKIPACTTQESGEERYTTPVPKRAVAQHNLLQGTGDYLQVVGDAKRSKVKPGPVYVDIPIDSDDDVDNAAFAKDCEDYIQPSPKALDNFHAYVYHTDHANPG